MLIVDQIRSLTNGIKSQIDIAHDNGDKYCYIELKQEELKYHWNESNINEILRKIQDVDANLISHSVHTSTLFMSPPANGTREIKNITLLFELIYN